MLIRLYAYVMDIWSYKDLMTRCLYITYITEP